jgi:hypothetical protein
MRAQQVHNPRNIIVLIPTVSNAIKNALKAQLVAIRVALLAHTVAKNQNAIAWLQFKFAE